MTKQVFVGKIDPEEWDSFLKDNNRSYDNQFVRPLVNIYDSFFGRYLLDDNSRLEKIPFIAERAKSKSDFLVQLALPKSWGDFEMCISTEMVHVETNIGGERREGILRKDGGFTYELQGFELVDKLGVGESEV